MNKVCSKCNLAKEYNLFYKSNCHADNLYPSCKDCKKQFRILNKEKINLSLKNYRTENREKVLLIKKKHYIKNKDVILKQKRDYYSNNLPLIKEGLELRKHRIKKTRQNYYYSNKDKIFKNIKSRKENDLNFKLASNCRSRIIDALKRTNNKKNSKTVEILGCSIEYLRKHLESKFQEGMTWDNYGFYGWHMDHIIPLSKFDLTKEKELKKACHYTNIQPLWANDNFKKSDKV